MRLARAELGGRVVAVCVHEDVVVEIRGAADPGPDGDPLLALLRAGLADLQVPGPAEADRADVHARSDVRLLAPLRRPGKIVAVGLNYTDHTAETGLTPPTEPLTFAKYPTSVIGPGEHIVVPRQLTTQVDWEAELAVVVGACRGPGSPATLADIAGYTVANDVSARDLQFRDGQWTRGKSLDTFCPLGPVLVTPDEAGEVGAARIWARVDGRLMQDASTADMIFDIPALLRFISSTVTLEPGDVILTGTPPGVGGFRKPPVFLQHGSQVEVGVEGVGVLSNPVRHI